MNNKGFVNIITTIFTLFITLIILIFFSIFQLIQTRDLVIADVKEDMYSINRNAIVALDKNQEKLNINSFQSNIYEQQLKQMLIKNYGLNEELKQGTKLVEKIEYDYNYYEQENIIKTTLKI